MRLTCRFRYMPAPKTIGRSAARFRLTAGRVYEALADEIRMVSGSDVIIEAGFRDDQIRNDGWPYSSARPEHSAVRVSFTTPRYGPLSFDCATFSNIDDNLHAIAKTMNALRAVERYGAVKGGQQYRGWKQLPEQPAPTQDPIAKAAETLANASGLSTSANVLTTPGTTHLEEVYRIAARKNHPDLGGDPAKMAAINDAKEVLARHREYRAA